MDINYGPNTKMEEGLGSSRVPAGQGLCGSYSFYCSCGSPKATLTQKMLKDPCFVSISLQLQVLEFNQEQNNDFLGHNELWREYYVCIGQIFYGHQW